MLRGIATLAAATAAVLLLTGCAALTASAGDAPVTRENLPEIVASDQQLIELENGVTQEEYRAAFDRFDACMTGAKQPLVGVEEGEYLITYSMLASAYDSGDYDRCYFTEFQRIDEKWQYLNKDNSTANRVYQACLTAMGIPPKESSEDVWAQLLEAGIDPEKCAQSQLP
ncbi:hypothetical protein E3T28_00390 [Cryobacterium sinapicolor]|uniref:Lipoprotein n=1 Tax=Cryobacterium sinapicolor TaxID=1259236 RepID=A0ABY2JHH7_9MICO|nr:MULTISPECIES: hypothetical protein [Cryobacterium]TFC88826.1 hypothetical protein E3O67_07555 [Cryobacterium sp. TMT3-29-2]TFD05822.1 hypothetical protein E3T28_00390 [Cryobacterium sinapicolor]